MGVSTDALLVYGYVWDDEADLLAGDDESDEGTYEWDEVLARQRGTASPWDSYPDDLENLPYAEQRRRGEEWTAAHRSDLDAWHAARTAVKAEYGVEISRHGSDQWSCPVVQIAGAGHRAYRGDVHALTADSLAIDPEWDGKLQRFVTDLGISTDEAKGPGWFLLSWWG